MSDLEKKISLDNAISENLSSDDFQSEKAPQSKWKQFFSDFKRPNEHDFDSTGMTHEQIAFTLIQRSKPQLKKRHLRAVAAAGGIGTGLFIGTGSSLKNGGPAALTIGFGIVGICIVCTMCAMGELGVRYPVPGSFTTYASRFLDPSWGFTLSWLYAFNWMVVIPLEIVAASMTIYYWHTDNNSAAHVNVVAWVPLFYVALLALNLFGAKGYGEAEFLFSTIKVCAMIGFIIFSIVITAGGGPVPYRGAKYFDDPGAFANGFKGVVTVLVSCAFAFGGTEISGIAATETKNPAHAIPSAVKQVLWRTIIFFIVGTLMLGFMLPYNGDPRLGTDDGSGQSVSPFVLALEHSMVNAVPSIFNSVIIISVFSVANAAIFASSRTFVAIGLAGYGPGWLTRWLTYIDRRGRPLGALTICFVFGLLCFVAASDAHVEVFNWLYAFSALSFLYAWGTVCLVHIRVRMAMRRQGISTSELQYKASTGVIGSFIGLGICIAIFGLQWWTSLFPLNGKPDARIFFQADLSVPCVIVMYVGHKLYTKSPLYIKLEDMDITSGVREITEETIRENEIENEARRNANFFKKIINFMC